MQLPSPDHAANNNYRTKRKQNDTGLTEALLKTFQRRNNRVPLGNPLSRLITNNKNFPRSKKKSRRALDSYIVFRMGENRTRAEPPSTEFKNSTRWLLLRMHGQSVALFPIERSKGGETIIFKPPPSPSPSIRVSLEEEAERHAYKDRESFFCC